jgi:hypothetical protein
MACPVFINDTWRAGTPTLCLRTKCVRNVLLLCLSTFVKFKCKIVPVYAMTVYGDSGDTAPYLLSSGMLRGAERQLLTDVSGQSIDPIFRGSSSLALLDPWRWDPIGCPETSVRYCLPAPRNIPSWRKREITHSLFLTSALDNGQVVNFTSRPL